MGLSIGELTKREGRVETFVDMWANQTPFLFDDGKARKINTIIFSKQIQFSINALKKDKKTRDTQLSQVISSLKSAKGTLSVLAEEGKQLKQFSFGKLVKTKEFGGQGSAEGTSSGKISGGTITEVLSETGFCFYYALLVTNQLDTFKKESFKTVTNKKAYVDLIEKLGLKEQLKDSLNDTQLQKYIPIMYDFLGTGFDEILRAQVKKFKKDYSNVDSKFYMARSGAIPDEYNPYTTYRAITKQMQKKYNLDSVIGEDKWNPADLWIYNDAAIKKLKELNAAADKLRSQDPDGYKVAILDLVNENIYNLYKKDKSCFPVSLKKSSLYPHIDEINVKGAFERIVTFDKVELSQGNIDVKIHFTLKIYQGNKLIDSNNKLRVKMKAGASGGYRLEIEGGKEARFGSVGTGIWQFIIRETDNSGLKVLEKIRKDIKEDNETLKTVIPSSNDKQWFGGSNYKSLSNKLAGQLEPYLQKMFQKVNNSKEIFDVKQVKTGALNEKLYNKTSAAEIAIAISQIVNKYARDIVVENIVDAAASARISAGIRPEQIEARKKQLGGKLDKDFKSLPADSKLTNLVFTSCFHLKIS